MTAYNPIEAIGLDAATYNDCRHLERILADLVRHYPRREEIGDSALSTLIALLAIDMGYRRSRNKHRHIAACIESSLAEGAWTMYVSEDDSLDYRTGVFLKSIKRMHRASGHGAELEMLHCLIEYMLGDGISEENIKDVVNKAIGA